MIGLMSLKKVKKLISFVDKVKIHSIYNYNLSHRFIKSAAPEWRSVVTPASPFNLGCFSLGYKISVLVSRRLS